MAHEGFVAALTATLDADPALAASLIVSTWGDAGRWAHLDVATDAADLQRDEPVVEG